MNRFTLFALFLCSIIVMIVAEIMVNEYLRTPYSIEGAASVFHSDQVKNQATNNQQSSASTTSEGNRSQATTSGSITAQLLKNAGLDSYTFQVVPYAEKLLDRIAFNDLNFIPTFESHLIKNGVARVASFYEFNSGSAQSAQEVLDLVKQKCTAEIGVILNQSNSFGDNSFYVNYFEFPEKVFLVFRKGTRVFAFTYGKEMHSAITQLISQL